MPYRGMGVVSSQDKIQDIGREFNHIPALQRSVSEEVVLPKQISAYHRSH